MHPAWYRNAPADSRNSTFSSLLRLPSRLQGAFVKRHKVFANDGHVISPEDFTIGETIVVYGRNIFLNDCDEYTRQWYQDKMHKEQSEGLPYPLDLNAAFRENLQDRSLRAQRVGEQTLRQHDLPFVLRTLTLGCLRAVRVDKRQML